MHIAYSALKSQGSQIIANQPAEQQQHHLRLKAYQTTCQKFCKEIAAIQKYLPGWVPAYPAL